MAETAVEETFEAPAPTGVTVTFHARAHNLMLTRFPAVRETYGGGLQRDVSPGLRYSFRDHKLVVDDELRRETADFLKRHGSHYYTFGEDLRAAAALPVEDWLREHTGCNGQGVDSFREITPVVPAAETELGAILQAQIDSDEDKLREIYEAELAGHKRPNVLQGAQLALEAIYRDRALETVTEPQEPAEEPSEQ
jgi:hypothetical protein